MGVSEFEDFEDMIESSELLPVYGLRVLVGLDKDSEITLCLNKVGTIEPMTLLGVFETIKARILEA